MAAHPVAVLEHAPTPYRPAIFEEVGKTRDVDVFYYRADESRNRWAPCAAGGGTRFSERTPVSLELGPFVLLPTLPYHLLRGEYEEVVGNSDINTLPTMALVLPIVLLTDTELTIWTEEIDSEHRYEKYADRPYRVRIAAELFWLWGRLCQFFLYRSASRVIAYSELARDAALKRGASSSKTTTRPQAIDPAVVSAPDPDVRPTRGDPTVLFLGSIEERKGIDVLVDALPLLPSSASVWIAGEGEERETVERLTASDDRVEVFGRVDESTKAALLRRADVLALPSRHEPWGIVVLEALACGTPAVTTTAAGAAMVLDDSAVVPPGDAEQLADALVQSAGTDFDSPPTPPAMAEPLCYSDSCQNGV